jgi:hypothetical protein
MVDKVHNIVINQFLMRLIYKNNIVFIIIMSGQIYVPGAYGQPGRTVNVSNGSAYVPGAYGRPGQTVNVSGGQAYIPGAYGQPGQNVTVKK